MMKATAPMTGGMIWPPIEDGRLDAAGEGAAKPKRFISGMVNWPTVTTLATPEPEIVPISAEANTRDLAPGRRARGRTGRSETSLKSCDHAGAFEEGAEQDEEEDVGRPRRRSACRRCLRCRRRDGR